MKKIFLIALVILCIAGCSHGEKTNYSEHSYESLSSNSIVPSISTESSASNQTIYSENPEIENFLTDSNKSTEEKLEDLRLPADFSMTFNTALSKGESFDGEIEILSVDCTFADLESKMPIVSINRTALLSMTSPFFDNNYNAYFLVKDAEAILNCDINWVKDTGIEVPDTDGFYRGYHISKSEAGGYIYTFVDFNAVRKSTTVKAIMYIDKILSTDDFENISIGKSISEVGEICTVGKICANNLDLYNGKLQHLYYLDSGILKLIYEQNGIITEMEYMDFTFPNFFLGNDKLDSRSYDLTILPQDYPPVD